MKKDTFLYCLFLIFTTSISFAQSRVAIKVTDSLKNNNIKYNFKQLIIPSVLITYGIWATDNDQLELINEEIKEDVFEHIDEKISIDDFTQYLPLATTFTLDLSGIKGKNNLKDKTIIAATATIIMGTTVIAMKKVSNVQRPDGTSVNSFPSGHTATAFMGAELLYQEYKDVSVWYGISGYLVASGTGVFRMLNNRHWLSDVVTGAGIGILSTKVSYWLYPSINKLFTNKKTTNTKTAIIPYYDGKTSGFCFVSTF